MKTTSKYSAFPSRREFKDLCSNEKPLIPPLYCELPFKNPASVFEAVRGKAAVLLESIKGPDKIARYSFITFNPFLEMIVKDQLVEIVKDDRRSISSVRPLTRLREILNAYPQKNSPHLPPFQGGAIGLLSYDFVHYIERLPKTARDDLNIPDAHFYIVDQLFAFDHRQHRAYAIICPGARCIELGYTSLSDAPLLQDSLNILYDEAEERLHKMVELYSGCPSEIDYTIPDKKKRMVIQHEMKQSQYMEMVRRAKEYIRAGDIFQANLSQRLSAHIGNTSVWQLYRILRSINPSPFSFFVDFGDYQLVSSSPERLIKLSDRIAQTRPIAGTRPRGISPKFDEWMRADLLLNEKERAEHIMLIDLERNDLGKVCDYGTVEVDELMITEDYSHVIHIVSNVRGRLTEGRDAMSLIRAVFPGGTITGVPKVRCMEIIDELEPVTRGPYTGSFGYISFSGDMDLNIIIRTMVIKNSVSYVQAGAGIVADSDPEREYFESLKKAEALLSTLERI
jgi:anthranilate/para-aminobenzoate synthase component I